MKVAESKTAATAQQSHASRQAEQPFFQRQLEGGQSAFFGQQKEAPTAFFQPKLKIGAPNDHYEQQADAVADKVVAKLNSPTSSPPTPKGSVIDSTTSNGGTIASSTSNGRTAVQTKGSEGEQEEKLQKKDEEISTLSGGELQRKPIFDSNVEAVQPYIQRKPIFDSANDDGLQMKAESENTDGTSRNNREGATSSNFESQLAASKGGGTSLPLATQQQMGDAIGADFSGVRVHTGSEAASLSNNIGAQAFTHGNDVYFNEGKYNPSSTEGAHLLAHELTHTVQQGAAVRREVKTQDELEFKPLQRKVAPDIQRDPPTASGGAATAPTVAPGSITDLSQIEAPPEGRIEQAGGATLMKLRNFKVKRNVSAMFEGPPYQFAKGTRNTRQATVWNSAVRNDVREKLGELVNSGGGATTAGQMLRLELKRNPSISIIGTMTQLVNECLVPFWDIDGNPTTFEIEHIVDWQIAGGNKNVDQATNLILLERAVNGDFGNRINQYKKGQVAKVLNHYRQRGGVVAADNDAALQDYTITAETIDTSFDVLGSILVSSQMAGTARSPFLAANIDIRHYQVRDGCFLLRTASRGVAYEMRYDQTNLETNSFSIHIEADATAKTVSRMTLTPKVDDNIARPGTPIEFVPERLGTDEFRIPNLRQRTRNLMELKALSPVEFDEFDLDNTFNIQARGRVLPTIPFFRDANIQIVIDSRGISVGKVFSSGELRGIPPPFRVTDASLGLFINSQHGFMATGDVFFAIDRVGTGHVGGFVGADGKLGLQGDFDFDRRLFDNARVSVRYENDQWTISGTLAIPRGKITGIKQATATVTYTSGLLTATGNAELDVKGLQRGTMNLRYENESLTVGGDFTLSDEIPRIRGGRVAASITKTGDEYNITAAGTASLDIPGLESTTITVGYDNGALTIEGNVEYARGIVRGRILVGATNRRVSPEGVLSGDPGDTWRVYGAGSLTLRLTPWLEATAGITVSPLGVITISGRIGLPNTVNVFDRRSFNRRLFDFPTLEIPLFAIPLGPRSLGLVATIGGGIDFDAGFGPGQLQDLSADITYTIGQEDSISLGGHARFVVPADATLRFFGRAGVGLSIGVARVSGGIELGAGVGIRGAAEAQVDVNWTPRSGITLDAVGRVYVEPALRFDVNLYLEASALFLSHEWHKRLAQREFGSGMRFGLEFPIHYEQGQDFNLSWDDLRVIYPNIDFSEVISHFKDELLE